MTFDYEENRQWIERVVLWAVDESDNAVDHVREIGDSGMPDENDHEGMDTHFVFWPDLSPYEKSWDEIYAATVPTNYMFREILGHRLLGTLALPGRGIQPPPEMSN